MLAIEVELRHGRYDATLAGPGFGAPEWPPHPARVFMALVASASSDAEFAALEWLEGCGPPDIYASADAHETNERRFVVTNKTVTKGSGNLTWPGRTNGVRVRSGVVVAESTFALAWSDAEPPAGVQQTLTELARSTPYVGRVSSESRVRIRSALELRPQWRRFMPVGLDATGALLRTPYPGFTRALRDAYDAGQRAHLVTRDVPYSPEPDEADGEPVRRGPFGELIVFGFARPTAAVDGTSIVRVTSMLRRAVHERVGRMFGSPPLDPGEALPAVVSGHGADGQTHLAYLALLDAGYTHSDGHILGVALALPRDVSVADRRAVLQAVVADELQTLRLSRSVAVALEPAFGSDSNPGTRRAGLDPNRWSGGDGGACIWTTATPIALDHHSRSRESDEEFVVAAALRSGYPEPTSIETRRTGFVPGAAHRPSLRELPPRRRRPLVHARVEFAEPLVGPVIIGSLRYLGLGLCMPTPARRAGDDR